MTIWELLANYTLDELEDMYPGFYEDYIEGKIDA